MFDYAIIGSGPSGATIAYELSSAGANCILLEAGTEYHSKSFPKNEADIFYQLFWNGGPKLTTNGQISLLRARVLGGSSIVNHAQMERLDSFGLENLKEETNISFFSAEQFEPHYRAIESMLSITPVSPDNWNENANIFTSSMEKIGYEWKPVMRAASHCNTDTEKNDCIACFSGCQRNSKQSTLITSIEKARKTGLGILTNFEVNKLIHKKKQVRILGVQNGKKREIQASKVILAAGALGTTAIMLRSGFQKRLPLLGKNFSCHPQISGFALFDRNINAHKGAYISVHSDDIKLKRLGIKLTSTFTPPVCTATLLPDFGAKHQNIMGLYQKLASIDLSIQDEAWGEVYIGLNGRMKIRKPLSESDRQKFRIGLTLVKELFGIAKAKKIIATRQFLGLQPMGGCKIGEDWKKSVVAPDFSVFNYPQIYIADSSIFPISIGVNPSLTIMAISHMAANSILRR